MLGAGLMFRFSVKSTAVVWFPLVWAMAPVKKDDRTWIQHLAIEQDRGIPQFVAKWSWFCIAVFVLKYVVWAIRYEGAALVDSIGLWLAKWGFGTVTENVQAIAELVRPGAILWWEIGVVANSMLGLTYWWLSRTWVAESRHGVSVSDSKIESFTRWIFFFRRPLTLYLIICNGYIVLRMARYLPVPEIGGSPFPWN